LSSAIEHHQQQRAISIQAEIKRLLEKHATAPSAARLGYARYYLLALAFSLNTMRLSVMRSTS
jgi:hypothetical protein